MKSSRGIFDESLMRFAEASRAGFTRRADLNIFESLSTLATASSYAASGVANFSVWAHATIFAVWRRLSNTMMSSYRAKRASSQIFSPFGSVSFSKRPTHS